MFVFKRLASYLPVPSRSSSLVKRWKRVCARPLGSRAKCPGFGFEKSGHPGTTILVVLFPLTVNANRRQRQDRQKLITHKQNTHHNVNTLLKCAATARRSSLVWLSASWRIIMLSSKLTPLHPLGYLSPTSHCCKFVHRRMLVLTFLHARIVCCVFVNFSACQEFMF